MIKRRKIGWVGRVEDWDRLEMHTYFSQESLKERYQLEDLGVDDRILKLTIKIR
jgi:hypothetical protein